MNRTEALQILSGHVAQCTRCPELVKSRTQTVFGEGNPHTRVVFVGEAPGEVEDRTGRPFVGPAGQMLDQIIREIGWDRKDVFICNILRCRPPRNRVPEAQECENCKDWLTLTLEVIRPDYIVCLGATAARNILQTDRSVGRLRGTWHRYQDGAYTAKVLVSYHPSYLLREPSSRSSVIADLGMLLDEMAADQTS